MSADRTTFVISKPLFDATAEKRMPTSSVKLLHQSSYFNFFQSHLTQISYMRLISFELMELFNSFKRKTYLQLITFSFYKTVNIQSFSVKIMPDLFNFVLERFIIFRADYIIQCLTVNLKCRKIYFLQSFKITQPCIYYQTG